MYYIINQSDQVVAIDPQLLSALGMKSGDDFYKKVALKEILFQAEGSTVEISVDGEAYSFDAEISTMEGLLGDIRLVVLTKRHVSDKTESEEMITFDDIELFDIKEEESPQKVSVDVEKEDTEDENLFELVLPSDAENAISDIDTSDIEPLEESTSPFEDEISVAQESSLPESQEENSPIYIDVERVSEKIGISTDDYTLFLNEYIDTALSYEKALQSDNEMEKEEALSALIHLSNVLHLPFVGDVLGQIKEAAPDQRDRFIGSFFETLGRLTTAHFEEEKRAPETTSDQPSPEEQRVTEAKTPQITQTAIDLSDVQPIHFDFQLEEAAKDLSLPIELIEEFVNDFITQAHEETKRMLAAYEKGDLETVQKIGHLLKGTSSNLRINPLSDTLYEIQFNEDIDRVPELVRNYWGHFLSLEKQIELISKK